MGMGRSMGMGMGMSKSKSKCKRKSLSKSKCRSHFGSSRGPSGPGLSQDGITSGSDSCTFPRVAMQEGAILSLPPTSTLSLLPSGN